MTDLFTAELEGNPEPPGEFSATLKGRTCKQKNPDGTLCGNPLPENSPPGRKYCEEHYVGNGGRAKRRREGRTGEKRPASVNVNVGGPRPTGGKKDQRARETAAGAEAFLKVAATGWAMTGDDICPASVSAGAPRWGEAVGELSKYQPWLANIFAPVGGDNQLGAWLGLLAASVPIVLPVLAHHNLLPDAIGVKLGGVMVAASDLNPQPEQQPTA